MYASERSQKFVTLLYRQLSLFGDSDDVLLEVQKICQRNLKYSSYCTVNNLLQKKLKLRNESGILELLHETAANPFTVREIKDWKAFADEFPTAKESATDSQELVKPQNSEILVVELSKEAFKSLVIG